MCERGGEFTESVFSCKLMKKETAHGRIPEGGQGVRTPPLKITRNRVSKHTGHHKATKAISETPFKCYFAGGPAMARL